MAQTGNTRQVWASVGFGVLVLGLAPFRLGANWAPAVHLGPVLCRQAAADSNHSGCGHWVENSYVVCGVGGMGTGVSRRQKTAELDTGESCNPANAG